jgi:hypothetical protein
VAVAIHQERRILVEIDDLAVIGMSPIPGFLEINLDYWYNIFLMLISGFRRWFMTTEEKEAVKNCQYYKCKRMTLPNDDYCIFHSEDIKGKKDKFNDEFMKEFERQEKEEKRFQFIGFVFPGDIWFGGKVFKKDADFYEATFEGDAGFNEATFKKEARFYKATFSGDAGFMNVKFTGKAGFVEVTFAGDARFYEAMFTGNAEFDLTKFVGYAGFDDATFAGDALFDSTIFERETRFYQTTFEKDARFEEATFNNISQEKIGKFSRWCS